MIWGYWLITIWASVSVGFLIGFVTAAMFVAGKEAMSSCKAGAIDRHGQEGIGRWIC